MATSIFVTTHHQHSSSSLFKGFENVKHAYPSGTGDPNDSDIIWVENLEPPGSIGCPISRFGTTKSDYFTNFLHNSLGTLFLATLSKAKGLKELQRFFPFTEPALSEILWSLRFLRMTGSEGFRASAHTLRMTGKVLSFSYRLDFSQDLFITIAFKLYRLCRTDGSADAASVTGKVIDFGQPFFGVHSG